jgi:hypothetical protein
MQGIGVNCKRGWETLNIMRVPIAGLIKNSIIEAVIDDRGFG